MVPVGPGGVLLDVDSFIGPDLDFVLSRWGPEGCVPKDVSGGATSETGGSRLCSEVPGAGMPLTAPGAIRNSTNNSEKMTFR